MRRFSQIETVHLYDRITKNVIALKIFAAIVLMILPHLAGAQSNLCLSLFQFESEVTADNRPLSEEDDLVIKNISPAYLKKLEKNNEPTAKIIKGPRRYKAPNVRIYDNARLYEPAYMLRFDGVRLIKMYRGLRIEEGEMVRMKSEQLGNPIWITPDYEHARLYAAEWTPVFSPENATPIILEMWIPEFLIYWRNDPRIEGMAEAFIYDKDIKTLESFTSKIHRLKNSEKKQIDNWGF